MSYADRLKQKGPSSDGASQGQVTEVIVDGLVALQIVKHFQENTGDVVTGMLLGIDEGSKLNITHCFPIPNTFPNSRRENQYKSNRWGNDDDDEDTRASEDEAARMDYQIGMLQCLRDINVDAYCVGWYQSSSLSSHVNDGTLESQFSYQSNRLLSPNCVSLVYDPVLTQRTGRLSLRALRLTDAVMEILEAGDRSASALKDLSHTELFLNIPVKVVNSTLANAFLQTMIINGDIPEESNSHLDLASNSLLEKNTDLLSGCIDQLQNDASRYQYWVKQTQRAQSLTHKRRLENQQRATLEQPLLPADPGYKVAPAPPRLSTLVTAAQADAYVKQGEAISHEVSLKTMALSELAK